MPSHPTRSRPSDVPRAVTAVAGLVLTGGASRRFGAPKADLRVAGERLADRTARLLRTVADPTLEVGPGWSSLPAVVEDPAGAGPLAALAAGAAALADVGAGDRDALVVAVDLPALDPALLALLAAIDTGPDTHADTDAVAPAPFDAVVPRVDGRAQPLCARYSAGALARAGGLVAAGERSMRALLEVVTVRWVDDDEWGTVTTAACFADVDTPDDARRFGLETPG